MKIFYDKKADALYIRLKKARIDESDEITKGIVVDFDKKGKPVGIEFLNATSLFGRKDKMNVEMALAGSN